MEVRKHCLQVFVVLLVWALLLLLYSDEHIFGRTKDNKINQDLSFIQRNGVWNEHIVTNNILYRGGRYLTEENMENIKVLSVNQCKKRRYLVYKCDSSSLCGGWGDRQNGIVSSFLLALLTNRTFIIDMTKPCELENFLSSNVYNWSICSKYLSTLPKKNFSNFDYVVGSRKFLKEIQHFNFDRNWTTQVVVLRFNAYMRVIDGIRKHKQAKTRLAWLLNTTNEEVIHLVLQTLFYPNQRLLDDVVRLDTNRIHGKHLVCSHIRKGKNPSIPGDNKLPRGTPNETLIFDFLKSYDDDRKYAIYIATDSDEVRMLAEANIESYININRPIVHVDRLGKLKKSTVEACEGFYTAIFEQFLLSLCDTLVLTRSNFGGIAAYIRGISDNLFLYNQKTDIIFRSNLTYMQRVFKFI